VASIFERLIGLETEYAIRFRAGDPSAPRLPRFRIYEAVLAALQQRIVTVRARHFKEGVFLANGGAVWFEAERPASGGGLIEGATPECRTPRQLIAYQRAQDRLLAEAALTDKLPGQVRLLKNDRDAHDNVYGAQDNYEAALASGPLLWLWRLGLVALLPLAIVTWTGIAACLLLVLCYFAFAGLVYLAGRYLVSDRNWLATLLFGTDLAEGRGTCVHAPIWLESMLQLAARVITGPLAVALDLLLRGTVFRRIRRQLTPFLVTRPLLAGAGMIDRAGDFLLSDKGPAINCVLGFGGFWGDRPLYNMGHFFKAIYAQAWFSPREYSRLFAARQRLQIGLGDSNMCEVAEYLRVGATLLVLDAIEAGHLSSIPRMASPIRALHAVCRDTVFREPMASLDERPATALQVQWHYYQACHDFVSGSADAPPEAAEILELWRAALEGVEQFATQGQIPATLVGTLDWATKKYLLDHAAPRACWAERKKIDLCYHELSAEGYFEMLRQAGTFPAIVAPEEVERAMRVPPADSPATMRGHYIREFSTGEQPMTASWSSVTLGSGWNAHVIPLARRQRRVAPRHGVTGSSTSGHQT
jgi:proteasome accessory factor A